MNQKTIDKIVTKTYQSYGNQKGVLSSVAKIAVRLTDKFWRNMIRKAIKEEITAIFEKLETVYEEKYDDEPVPFDDIEELLKEKLEKRLLKRD